MHILFVIPHYVRMPDAAAIAETAAARPLAHPTLSCMAKIAALGDTLAALMSHFGSRRHDLEGDAIAAPHSADIVLVTQQGANVLPYLDYAAIAETVTVEGDPMSIPWHCHDQLRARRSAYDWYCYLEDDIVIHDPGFFDKLAWFQAAFGPKAVLQPTIQRMEASEGVIRGSIDSLMKLVGALDAAGIELIGEGSVSQKGGRGVRLKGD